MTIRVTIKNEEMVGGRTVKVIVGRTPRGKDRTEQWGGDIAPQGEREFHVHMAQHLIIEERDPSGD